MTEAGIHAWTTWTEMILAGAALLDYVGTQNADRASRAIYESVFETVYDGKATTDLGGQMSTTEFTDEVIRRIVGKLEADGLIVSAQPLHG